MKKRLLTIPATILAALAVAGIVAAHNATASGTCQSGVTWSATTYDKLVVNSITVTIDGAVAWHDPDFKSSDTGTITTDKTVSHVWAVTVDAPGTQYDRALAGSYGACETAPTTTMAPTTTLPTTTTTAPAPTTTTVVAVDIPPVPTTVAIDVAVLTPEPTLPATGVKAGDIVFIAGICICFGGLLLSVRRKP
jgi:LPXTG-motif cell wall-anchored protein